jgi:predicted nucleotidyltransferase
MLEKLFISNIKDLFISVYFARGNARCKSDIDVFINGHVKEFENNRPITSLIFG